MEAQAGAERRDRVHLRSRPASSGGGGKLHRLPNGRCADKCPTGSYASSAALGACTACDDGRALPQPASAECEAGYIRIGYSCQIGNITAVATSAESEKGGGGKGR